MHCNHHHHKHHNAFLYADRSADRTDYLWDIDILIGLGHSLLFEILLHNAADFADVDILNASDLDCILGVRFVDSYHAVD
jgi:hypothetical protein